MYFAIGWPQTLSSSEDIHQIVSNSDHSIFIFLSDDCIQLWYSRPVVLIVQYRRTTSSVQKYGHNVSAVWKSDSSQIVLQTSKDFLLFYHVIIGEDSDTILHLIEPNSKSQSENTEINKVPALVIELQHVLHIPDGITCIMSAEEEVVVSTRNGSLSGVEWDGVFDENFNLNISVPQNYHQKKGDQSNACFIIDFKYSTIIGGFSLVFSNGLGAFLPLNENSLQYTQMQLISHVDNALCTAINHKYALIVFGLISSEGLICGFDEIDRRFIISHRLTLPSNIYPDVDKFLGPLTALQWTPDSTVLATVWENGGFALWTVFGSLLTCSLSWNFSSLDIDVKLHGNLFRVASLAFGKEGFHLWMATRSSAQQISDEDDNASEKSKLFNWVCKLSLVKSVLAANPCSSVSVETVLLASEDRIFVGGNKSSSFTQAKLDESGNLTNFDQSINGKASNGIAPTFLQEQESNAVDSFQWITIPMPQSYLESNWPVRLFAIDPVTSQNVAIAGQNGLAIYSLLSRRWKLFGNENHEKDFIVTGGLLWFYDYIIAGCYNLTDDCFEIRAYSHRNKLDNSNAKIILIEREVHLLSLHRNRLLALCTNGSILLFDLHLFKRNHQHSTDSNYELNISAPISVIINNLEIFPDCVTVCLLTDLHVDMYHSSLFQSESSHRSHLIQSSAAARSHSILINICGRVLLLELDIDTTGLPLSSDDDEDNLSVNMNSKIVSAKVNGDYASSTIKFRKVVTLASNVENLWLLPHDEMQLNAFRPTSAYSNRSLQLRPHLVTSLYLSCGANGMAIWLSLEHLVRSQYPKGSKNYQSSENEHAYISKRIMLPIHEIASTIYPLAIRFREAIVLGAESDFTQPDPFSICHDKKENRSLFVPFCVVKRTSQVYLHYVLRELLRRNLGYRAWEIANTCTALPHFVHSLELLLHGVLEEEASSSQPIPDALLPRVVDFIRAFPVFLQTVIHCARKTELALWPHLFSIVGSPKDLFQQCLSEGQLETASSYIIVLQNLEKPEVATKCASRLLQAARIAGCWTTVKELKRFLRVTNYAEEAELATGQNRINESPDIALSLDDHLKVDPKELINTPTVTSQYPTAISILPVYSNGTEHQSAKDSSYSASLIHNNNINNHANHNLINNNNKIIPGAAIKHNNSEDNDDGNSNSTEEVNIVEDKESTPNSSLNNSDHNILSLKTDDDYEHPIKGDTKIFQNNNSSSHRNCRAYPGSILRMTYGSQPSNAFKFLANNSPSLGTAASSASSMSSISSASSSAISSTSVSPTARQIQRQQINSQVTICDNLGTINQANEIKQFGGATNGLQVIPIAGDDPSQCIIS